MTPLRQGHLVLQMGMLEPQYLQDAYCHVSVNIRFRKHLAFAVADLALRPKYSTKSIYARK